MGYSATCDCGIVYPVNPTDAGLPIDCKCGKSFYIPSLAKLRESAGETPVPLNTVETIQVMMRSGKLPSGDTCPYSGRPANETVFFRVHCENTWDGTDGAWSSDASTPKTILMMIIKIMFGGLGGLAIQAALNNSHRGDAYGEDTSIDVPLRVSADDREEILRIKDLSKL